MDTHDEKRLITKAQNGDVESFEKLISHCQQKAYNLCFHYMKNEQDAQDALQESFIKIFRYLKDFKGDSSFDTWAYRVVANTCNDQIKKGKRHSSAESLSQICQGEEISLDIPDISFSPEHVLDRKEKIRYILLCMDQLTDIYREVIILRDIQGFSYQQIAVFLNCTENAVKSRISRARTSLREILLIHDKEAALRWIYSSKKQIEKNNV